MGALIRQIEEKTIMVRYFTCVMIMLAISLSAARTQDKGFGMGIMLGEPTGLNAKIWTSPQNAVDVGLAWSFRGEGFFHFHADYLWHFPRAIRSTERFALYAGIGGLLGGRHESVLGIRVPLGIEWWPRNTSLDVFFELAPILDLAPATEFEMDGAIGIRFFFI
jgi:hypothetical protein